MDSIQKGSMESETSFDSTLHPTPIKTPLSSFRTLRAFSLCINYTKAPCTCHPSNAHENQDPCCTKVPFLIST